MAKEICISSTPHETRLAILEDDQLAEIYYERENEYTLAGSIYNGRVTRVLPGMQSAFVDLGLERDAFLYVTDFMELEDSEETDELEKAAASGANQAPREVRHSAQPDRNGGRLDDRQARSGQKQEQRQDRPPRDRRPVEEAEPEAPAAAPTPVSFVISEEAGEGQEDSGAQGARRWRGRRHRRGARGPTGSSEGRTESGQTMEITPEPAIESEIAPDIQASAFQSGDRPSHGSAPYAPRPSSHVPVPFVLPGESLSKYGGTPADDAPKSPPEPVAPARPSGFSKPSTLIETPISWDGSGLLPGESLSLHRSRQWEEVAEPEPQAEASSSASTPDQVEEYEFVEETEEFDPEPHGPAPEFEVGQVEEEAVQLESEEPPSAETSTFETETVFEEVFDAQPPVPMTSEESTESDASASHRIDPVPPTGFRLFGFGKKKDEEAEAKPVAGSVPSISSYAPGTGLIEEEVIDGEEFEAVPHHRHHKSDEHDLDDYEEETLPTQIRSGDLGELLQEAHLDHRIQLNFDEKNGEEEAFDEDEDEATADGQPSNGAAASTDSGQQRRDRGARGGRRGRGAPGAPERGNRRGGPSRRSMQTTDLPVISDLLKPGQEILVQIAKEPIAKKGARITSHIALPGRFLVFMPTVTHIGVSRKIASDEERQRLKRILVNERGESSGGFIVRTAAEGASEEDLRADLRFLMNLWNDIKQRSDSSKSPALIYHDLSLIERILRDQVSSNFSNIWVDSEADYERIVRFLNRFSPSLVRRVKLYTKETPLFEHFGIQDEISKALRSKVWLKSGGSIVINQTEALVAIDINTGKYVGKSARLEDTILKTNLDAVPEIVRQIRLRDLGGIIVIDFIDMDERKNRYKVMAALEEALKNDRAPTKVLQFNDFGLVAITRKRVKQSLERTLSVPCPTCQATGMVKSPTTVCNEIYTELRKMKKHFEGADILLRVNPETVKVLKSNNAAWLVEFEELTGKNILVKSDATLHPEQFDVQG
ncbi:MAG TPA: Rne/Rng family ribonuclease [Terracidiphilus sp.]|nr:Rne/Rng family ribonuclease [Terracidiphilus sp.]